MASTGKGLELFHYFNSNLTSIWFLHDLGPSVVQQVPALRLVKGHYDLRQSEVLIIEC